MKEKNYLLTYSKESIPATFKWFDTEVEMAAFLEQNPDIQIIDSMEVNVIREDILPYELDEV